MPNRVAGGQAYIVARPSVGKVINSVTGLLRVSNLLLLNTKIEIYLAQFLSRSDKMPIGFLATKPQQSHQLLTSLRSAYRTKHPVPRNHEEAALSSPQPTEAAQDQRGQTTLPGLWNS